MITGVDTIKQQTRAAYGCLVTCQSPVAVGLDYNLQAVRSLRPWHKKCHCSCSCGSVI